MDKCILCGSTNVKRLLSHFTPFIIERMFQGRKQSTDVLYCKECDFYASSYRPTEEELALFYKGYRDKDYQQQRQQHEPYYTQEFNYNLGYGKEALDSRRKHLYTILENHTDIQAIHTILDFGGDRGQFIPPELQAQKYVYEISHTKENDIASVCGGGVQFISQQKLHTQQWDLIICAHVLEHVTNPIEIITFLLSLIQKGGMIYFEVPYEPHWSPSLKTILKQYIRKPRTLFTPRRHYPGIHEHINQFRAKTFIRLLTQENIKILYLAQDNNLSCLITKTL